MNRYEFTITIAAESDTPDEAWRDAVMALSMEPGCTPDRSEYTTEAIDDE